MKSRNLTGGLVYSTESGRMCPLCRQPLGQCQCKLPVARAQGDGVVRVSRETRGRGGKAVTLVSGLELDDADLAVLAKRLKTASGSGGTVKAGAIELQGDHCERVVAALLLMGHRAKRAGG
jgi:translation initiation factor 1